ncbi:MAG: radical SAM protein [Planctomycetes bacterium]|nr:radical SAM protein [Planctomycetota bacterium]
MVRVEPHTSQSVLNTLRIVNGGWVRHFINPYRGCQFGCVYCYARGDKYYIHEDFERRIIAKENAPELLERRLAHARSLRPDVVGLSGATDAWQPLEKKARITRRVLEVLARHRFPVSVTTKSPLVARDIDLLQEIARTTWLSITITITSPHDRVARALEPFAPDPDRRFSTVEMLADAGLPVGVGVMPIVPRVTDGKEDLELLFRQAREAGARWLCHNSLRLEPGADRVFRDAMADHFPARLPALDRLYDSTGTVADAAYLQARDRFIRGLRQRFGLPSRQPRWIPDDFRRVNFLVAEVLINRALGGRPGAGDEDEDDDGSSRPAPGNRRRLSRARPPASCHGPADPDRFWAGHRINNLPFCVSTLRDDPAYLAETIGARGAVVAEVLALIARFLPARRGQLALPF